jgi:hypothetical protein
VNIPTIAIFAEDTGFTQRLCGVPLVISELIEGNLPIALAQFLQ